MTSFDYRQSRFERLAGIAPAAAFGPGARIPIVVVAALLMLIAAAWSFEAQRLSTLDRDVDALRVRAQATATAATRAKGLLVAIARDRDIDRRIADARRSAIVATNTVAQLGNALPHRTWLTNVAAAPGGIWTIAGRSTQVAEIGTTLQTIAHFDARARTHLISITATGRSARILDFVIVWERAS